MYTEIKFIFLMIVIDFESRNIKRNLIFKVPICAFVIHHSLIWFILIAIYEYRLNYLRLDRATREDRPYSIRDLSGHLISILYYTKYSFKGKHSFSQKALTL